jgi:hypothetical protein
MIIMSCAPKASKMVEYYKRIIADDKRQIKIIKQVICDMTSRHVEAGWDDTVKELDRLIQHRAICKENLKEWELYAERKEAWEYHVHDNGRSYGIN